MSKAPYDISGHAMLSARAKDLLEAPLDAHTRMAEYLLGVQAATFTSTQDTTVEIALAVQVNFQLEQGQEAAVYKDMRDGETWSSYQERATDPRALMMAVRLVADTSYTVYNPIGSLR